MKGNIFLILFLSLQIFLSWINSPGDFFIQFSDNQSVLDSLHEGLQNFYNGTQAVTISSITHGTMVVAQFSEDSNWYRGIVISSAGSLAEVEFVDYGNSEKVHVGKLRQVDKQFSNIPTQAVHCSLSGVQPLAQGNTWNSAAKDFLEKLCENGAVCRFVGHKVDLYEVELMVGGKDVALEMIAHAVVRPRKEPSPVTGTSDPKCIDRLEKKELSPITNTPGLKHSVLQDKREPSPNIGIQASYQPVTVEVGQRVKAYVAYSESVESFFVQLARNMNDLDDLMAQLDEHYRSPSRNSPPVYQVVCMFVDLQPYSL